MKLTEMSPAGRIAAGAGCVVVLAVVAGAIAYAAFAIRASVRLDREVAGALPGWMDSIRVQTRTPDLGGMLPVRNLDGDGANVVHDPVQMWGAASPEDAYRALLNPTPSATAADSARWREILADTVLDRFAAAARRRDWNAADRLLGAAGGSVRSNVFAMPVPDYRDVRNMTRALVVRGLLRLERRDFGGAQADFASATSLGERLVRREPVALGVFIGRAALSSAMRGWERYATATRDTALAARARRIMAWASGQPAIFTEVLIAAPDSALVLAGDTSIALGMRAEAMRNIVAAWIVRPRGFLLGPPAATLDALRGLTTSSDRDVAALANQALATATRMGRFRNGQLMREAERTR